MTARARVATESAASVALPGGELDYTLRRSAKARSVRVVIHPERGVVVTVPAGRVSAAEGERRAAAFLTERETWVRRHLARQAAQAAVIEARGGGRDGGRIPFHGELHTVRVVPAVRGVRRSDVAWFGDTRDLVVHRVDRDARPDPVILASWLREQALAAIDEAIRPHAAALGVTPTSVAVRDPRTRWGSASRGGRLSFSWRLILAPPEALDTVVVHELAHLRRFGHGPSFWAIVESRRPDHRIWRRWLHDHATELHGALG
jgi:predicted metal-dependent hydrolase